MVEDPQTFQPLFGSDKAACGFEIGDALVIKKSLADSVKQVGNTEYETSYSIVPKLMTIYRGYTWADIEHNGSVVRVITTHLESLWDKEKVPNSALQARQLVEDLKATSMPLIVMGDFNADPRDPRVNAEQNPGGQPEASKECPVGGKKCNAYWIMRDAGFSDAGPDATNPANHTWGMSALLAGPDLSRYMAALKQGNNFGFTDRLDYIFTSNGVNVQRSSIIGNKWPIGSTWDCSNEEQISHAVEVSEAMKVGLPNSGLCNSTDHAGVVATLTLANSSSISPALDGHEPFPISFWNWVGIALLVVVAYFIKRALSRRVVK
jgi:hypothetical protein